MPVAGTQTRRCIVDGGLGPVTVRLAAHRMLQAGGAFRVQALEGTTLEEWRIATGAIGSGDHVLETDPQTLHRAVMVWEILVCAHATELTSGTVEIVVLQQGVACPMTKAARWDLQEVPACNANRAIPIQASLQFLVP